MKNMKVVGRNERCPFGSGREYKKCCEMKRHTQRRLTARLFIPLLLTCCLLGAFYASFTLAPSPTHGKPCVELTSETEVLAYVGGQNNWQLKALQELKKGQEFQFDQHLCYIDQNGFIRMNPDVDVTKLYESDRTFQQDNWRFPESEDIVRFIDREHGHLRHDRVGTLQVGDRFWFQGRLYETVNDHESPTGLSIKNTGIVLSRVTNTFKRTAHTLIDLTIRDDEGNESIISGTPEHPFFVPAIEEYVSIGKLTTGTVLRTDDGTIATVIDTTPRHGTFTVYNIEVESAHNYYVSTSELRSAVLVHNMCDEVIKLTKAAKKKLGNLVSLKDMTAADAIILRGGGGSQVKQLQTGYGRLKVGELAKRAVDGDEAAETAIKIIKQASGKHQKYGGKQ